MSTLSYAIAYGSRGWKVFPCHYVLKDKSCSCGFPPGKGKGFCERAGKHPATRNGLKDATSEEAGIKALWNNRPYNIGLATGHDGIIVIDIDSDESKGKVGADTAKALETEHGPMPPTMTQVTGSGGRHLFYRSSQLIKNDQGKKLGKDIDVRGTGGYVILPPSNHTSGHIYKWANETAIAEMPEWMEERLTKSVKEINIADDKPEKFDKRDKIEKIGPADAKVLLKFIDPDDRDTWWTTGAALKTEFGEEEGRKLWDEWSATSSKFSEPDQERQWNSFEIGLYTAGTLFKYAKDGGFTNFDTEAAKSEEFTGNWIFVISIKRFINLKTFQRLDVDQFSYLYAPNFKKTSASNACLRNPEFPRVDGITFWPGQDRFVEEEGVRKLNLWTGSGLVASREKCTVFHDHLNYLIPSEEERKIVLDYLAFIVQNPGEKIHWAILVQGIQGNGKSYLSHAMRLILGPKNVNVVENETIHETFTAWQSNSQLIVVEELMARGRLELMNKLRTLITQPTSTVREMYQPAYSQTNRYNFLFLTNHEDAIIIDSKDRRYCVIRTAEDIHPKGEAYYKRLFEWTSDNPDRVLGYLSSRRIEGFPSKGHAPMTQGKRDLIAESLPPLDGWIKTQVDSALWPFSVDLVQATDIVPIVRELSMTSHPKEIGKAFSRLGYFNLGRTLVEGSSGELERVNLWAVRNAKVYQEMKAGQLRAAFNSQDPNRPVDGAGSAEEAEFAKSLRKKPVNQAEKTRPM